ncbi:MAG: DUF3761 domain-containing protein [Rubrobacter sp.]|nr:DUF3761 domain-containing protein [Rubrobacter sp.]
MSSLKRIALILTIAVLMATAVMGSGVSVQAQTADPSDPYQSATQGDLSNDNYYTNVDGNLVHSPAYTTDGSVPAGATAQCADGTYSFSQHTQGTCSYHGGVWQWL